MNQPNCNQEKWAIAALSYQTGREVAERAMEGAPGLWHWYSRSLAVSMAMIYAAWRITDASE